MIASQPQLLQIALDPGDVVYTPDWVAKDMVDFFNPSGRILEPCAGDGVFLKYLPPDTEWCEIKKGRDFFAIKQRYDYIFGNPPYRIFSKWLHHSFTFSDNIIYLIPLRAICQGYATMLDIHLWGGWLIKEFTVQATAWAFHLAGLVAQFTSNVATQAACSRVSMVDKTHPMNFIPPLDYP